MGKWWEDICEWFTYQLLLIRYKRALRRKMQEIEGRQMRRHLEQWEQDNA